MKSNYSRLIAKSLLLMTGLFALSNISAAAGVVIKDAWIREAPPGAHALAGYVSIKNSGKKATHLEGVSSDAFGMSMLHMSNMDKKKQMTMNHMDEILIPAGESVQLKPGGLHIMLMRPQKEFKAGDTVTITLEFSGDIKKKVRFSVLRK